ncbi:ciliary microtubule inner protein 5 [Pelodytes ibericus]
MGSKQVPMRRTTSAGYRLPDRGEAQLNSTSTVSLTKSLPGANQKPPLGSRPNEKQAWGDAVKRDHIWREFVEAEKRGEKQWDENWSFLKEYDALGNKREQEILPEEVPVFSEKIPNTTNQNIGSRINTELGKSLIYMDYLLMGRNQKKKLGGELLPS